MYHFIAIFDNMYADAINDDPVTIDIKVDTIPYGSEITERDVWKYAIDQAFDFQKKHDNLSFARLQLLTIC